MQGAKLNVIVDVELVDADEPNKEGQGNNCSSKLTCLEIQMRPDLLKHL